MVAGCSWFRETLLLQLFFWGLLGMPLSWLKIQKGGLAGQWIGYESGVWKVLFGISAGKVERGWSMGGKAHGLRQYPGAVVQVWTWPFWLCGYGTSTCASLPGAFVCLVRGARGWLVCEDTIGDCAFAKVGCLAVGGAEHAASSHSRA